MPTINDVRSWRGQDLVDADGGEIGSIEEIYVDSDSRTRPLSPPGGARDAQRDRAGPPVRGPRGPGLEAAARAQRLQGGPGPLAAAHASHARRDP